MTYSRYQKKENVSNKPLLFETMGKEFEDLIFKQLPNGQIQFKEVDKKYPIEKGLGKVLKEIVGKDKLGKKEFVNYLNKTLGEDTIKRISKMETSLEIYLEIKKRLAHIADDKLGKIQHV